MHVVQDQTNTYHNFRVWTHNLLPFRLNGGTNLRCKLAGWVAQQSFHIGSVI